MVGYSELPPGTGQQVNFQLDLLKLALMGLSPQMPTLARPLPKLIASLEFAAIISGLVLVDHHVAIRPA